MPSPAPLSRGSTGALAKNHSQTAQRVRPQSVEGSPEGEEGAMRRHEMSNDEVIAAFGDWCSQFKGGTFNGVPLVSDEMVEAEIAAVRKFARFIEPKRLAESTVAEVNAFRRQIPRGAKSEYAGIEWFRIFWQEVLKLPKTVRLGP